MDCKLHGAEMTLRNGVSTYVDEINMRRHILEIYGWRHQPGRLAGFPQLPSTQEQWHHHGHWKTRKCLVVGFWITGMLGYVNGERVFISCGGWKFFSVTLIQISWVHSLIPFNFCSCTSDEKDTKFCFIEVWGISLRGWLNVARKLSTRFQIRT